MNQLRISARNENERKTISVFREMALRDKFEINSELIRLIAKSLKEDRHYPPGNPQLTLETAETYVKPKPLTETEKWEQARAAALQRELDARMADWKRRGIVQ